MKKIINLFLLSNRARNYLCISIIFFLGLFSVSWFKGDNLLTLGDFYFPINRSQYLSNFFYSWSNSSAGMPQFRSVANIFPYGIFLLITEKLSISIITSEKIWFFLQFVSMGLSMFFLISVLLKNKTTNKNSIALIGAILFMFNPWLAVNVSFLNSYIVYGPLILGLYIKGLQEKKGFGFAILFSLIWLITSDSALINLRSFILQLILLLIYFAFFIITEKEKRKSAIIFSTYILAIFFFLSFYVVLPIVFYLFEIIGRTSDVYKSIDASWSGTFVQSSIKITNVWRLIGVWSFYESYKDVPYYYFNYLYKSTIFIFISYILTLLIYFPFTRLRKYSDKIKKGLIFLAILFIFGTFIMIGNNNIISAFLANHFKFYSMLFSIPYLFGGFFLIIGYCILFAFGFIEVLNTIKKKIFKYILSFLTILLVIIYGFPVYLGTFIYPGNEIIGSARSIIPEYYFDLKNSIENKKLDFKIFSLPYSKMGYFCTDWNPHGYCGVDFFEESIKKPVFSGVNISENIAKNLAAENNFESFIRNILLMNTRYFLIREDANFKFMKDNGWYVLPSENIIQKLKNSKEAINFGKIIIQKIDDDKFIPHFYIPKELLFSQRMSDELPRILSSKDYDIQSAIFFENQNPSKNLEFLKGQAKTKNLDEQVSESDNNNKLPILEFKKINPTKYRIRVHQAREEFSLIFSESFHEGWKAYITKVKSSKFKVQSNLSAYKILDGNEDDQASKDELTDFIGNSWISTLGDLKNKVIKHTKWVNMNERPDYTENYNIDFISKNFRNTIQNDNLPNGNIFETWFAKSWNMKHGTWNKFGLNKNVIQIPEEKHLIVNGYANSWIIDTDSLCLSGSQITNSESQDTNNIQNFNPPAGGQNSSKYCIRNGDGSYDFELVVDFWPQRLFYIGMGVSLLTLLTCLGYLIYDWRKRKKIA